jgi:hypothetical protein
MGVAEHTTPVWFSTELDRSQYLLQYDGENVKKLFCGWSAPDSGPTG